MLCSRGAGRLPAKGGDSLSSASPASASRGWSPRPDVESSARQLRWLEGRALSFGRHLSYWPFIEIMKDCFAIEDDRHRAEAWRKLEQGRVTLFGARAPEIIALSRHRALPGDAGRRRSG